VDERPCGSYAKKGAGGSGSDGGQAGAEDGGYQVRGLVAGQR
jgi:hypothetical protein